MSIPRRSIVDLPLAAGAGAAPVGGFSMAAPGARELPGIDADTLNPTEPDADLDTGPFDVPAFLRRQDG